MEVAARTYMQCYRGMRKSGRWEGMAVRFSCLPGGNTDNERGTC